MTSAIRFGAVTFGALGTGIRSPQFSRSSDIGFRGGLDRCDMGVGCNFGLPFHATSSIEGAEANFKLFMFLISSYCSSSSCLSATWSNSKSISSADFLPSFQADSLPSKLFSVFVTTKVNGLPVRRVTCVQSIPANQGPHVNVRVSCFLLEIHRLDGQGSEETH
ncbi:hypothetical protein K469DRAFT_693224 [Zopfia rhizophila CBS 207.26]|uniref:Uncharacterized protein n=1 Tax=Zopfia rhizophila CBS 207.26 TaxID=1314779 RepID=A0A6A6ESW9_9PEZI|nr:hypothetical protein K469DRAFT_693224 [Zopfia rhizophila CBS 207.26]